MGFFFVTCQQNAHTHCYNHLWVTLGRSWEVNQALLGTVGFSGTLLSTFIKFVFIFIDTSLSTQAALKGNIFNMYNKKFENLVRGSTLGPHLQKEGVHNMIWDYLFLEDNKLWIPLQNFLKHQLPTVAKTISMNMLNDKDVWFKNYYD